MHSDKHWSGPKAQKPGQEPSAGSFRGDCVLANSILRLRDSLWHYEFIYAVADGDIGRAMQVMSVWQFTFTGSGASKYSTELLSLACSFLYEFPESLRTLIKNNWLCNFSGLPGCWFPMDLMQEHHIRELKNKSQRRDQDFEGRFFQKVISRNTRWLTQIRSTINREVTLEDRSTSHGRAKRPATLNRLQASLKGEEVHAFSPGRSFGWLARDDLITGQKAMPAKVSAFLRRTLESGYDWAEATELGNEMQPEDLGIDPADGTEEDIDVPLPPMVVDGELFVGEALDQSTFDESFDVAHSEPLLDLE
ncbi:hypothetical protein RhiJN_09741 [Ceratobasidium sp. AG-Ba]|nr:hypothetical protein RhiJN_09741 [Ceratobasidium sp. AG-Ba]